MFGYRLIKRRDLASLLDHLRAYGETSDRLRRERDDARAERDAERRDRAAERDRALAADTVAVAREDFLQLVSDREAGREELLEVKLELLAALRQLNPAGGA